MPPEENRPVDLSARAQACRNTTRSEGGVSALPAVQEQGLHVRVLHAG